MCGILCRSGDTLTKNSVSLCQCLSTNDVHRNLQLYYSCQKDERAKPWSFQIGNGLLDLREYWTAECLHVVVVVVCFRELTVVVWSCSQTAEGSVWPRHTGRQNAATVRLQDRRLCTGQRTVPYGVHPVLVRPFILRLLV
jgi:hypothetical protein